MGSSCGVSEKLGKPCPTVGWGGDGNITQLLGAGDGLALKKDPYKAPWVGRACQSHGGHFGLAAVLRVSSHIRGAYLRAHSKSCWTYFAHPLTLRSRFRKSSGEPEVWEPQAHGSYPYQKILVHLYYIQNRSLGFPSRSLHAMLSNPTSPGSGQYCPHATIAKLWG